MKFCAGRSYVELVLGYGYRASFLKEKTKINFIGLIKLMLTRYLLQITNRSIGTTAVRIFLHPFVFCTGYLLDFIAVTINRIIQVQVERLSLKRDVSPKITIAKCFWWSECSQLTFQF
jgi:hypothetical protein